MGAGIRAVFLAGALLALSTARSYADQPNQLGVIMPLSGPAASYGATLEGAFRLAHAAHMRMVIEDDQCEAKKALSSYEKLRLQGVRVFYVACSGGVLALAPLAKAQGTLILTTNAASAAIRQTGTEVIRLNPDGVSIARQVTAYLKNRFGAALSVVALLHEEQDYAVSLANTLGDLLPGVTIIRESYPGDAVSVKSQLVKLNRPAVQAILFAPIAETTARIVLKDMAELRLAKPVIGEVNVCDFPFTLRDYGLNGACFAARFESPAFDEFMRSYRAANGRDSTTPFYDALTYDLALRIDEIAAHTQFAAPDGVAKLREELLRGFDGKFARYRFGSDGKVEDSGEYLKLKEFN